MSIALSRPCLCPMLPPWSTTNSFASQPRRARAFVAGHFQGRPQRPRPEAHDSLAWDPRLDEIRLEPFGDDSHSVGTARRSQLDPPGGVRDTPSARDAALCRGASHEVMDDEAERDTKASRARPLPPSLR